MDIGHVDTGHRGRDRRRPVDAGPDDRVQLFVAGILALVTILTAIGAQGDLLATTGSWTASLRAAQPVLLAVLAGVAVAHWHAMGHVHGLMVGVMAVLAAGQGALLLAGTTTGRVDDVVWLTLGGAAVAWLGRAVWGPDVDSRRRLLTEMAGAGLAVLVLSSILAVLRSAGMTGGPWLVGLVAVCWVVVGLAGLSRARERGWSMMAWASWSAIVLGVRDLALLMASVGSPVWFAGQVVATTGLTIAVLGGVIGLARAVTAQRGDVHGVLLGRRADEGRAQQAHRALAHEVGNAVLAIEAAADALGPADHGLSADDRQHLDQALRSGITRLRGLAAGPQPAPRVEAFALEDVVADCAATARRRGVRVHVTGSAPVPAVGDASLTTRVVDNLVLNAERHGGAGGDRHPIVMSVGTHGNTVAVSVEDEGPGVPLAQRHAIFRPGHRLVSSRPGDGLGLYVARDLMWAQRGDVWYEARPEGGARFIVSLPAGTGAFAGLLGPTGDEVEYRV